MTGNGASNGYKGLADEYEPFERQVAGHTLTLKSTPLESDDSYKRKKMEESSHPVMSLGVLRHRRTGHVLKPAQRTPRGEREIAFFARLFTRRMTPYNGNNEATSDSFPTVDKPYFDDGLSVTADPMLRRLADLVPRFYGTRMVDIFDNGYIFLEMEDITAKFRRPCIVDIKIGGVTWDPEAAPDKVKYEQVKYPLGQKLGFRLLGVRSSRTDGTLLVHDKQWSKTVKENQIVPALLEYLGDRPKAYKQRVVNEFHKRLELISSWIADQRVYTMYSSSILFVFEGDDQNSAEISNENLADARMIDFSHTFAQEGEGGVDENYEHGLLTLIKYWKKVERRL